MRSEKEIRRALNRATSEINNDEDDQILTEAVTELLTLRRRLGDREAIGKVIYSVLNGEIYSLNHPWEDVKEQLREGYRTDADTIIKYLTEPATPGGVGDGA